MKYPITIKVRTYNGWPIRAPASFWGKLLTKEQVDHIRKQYGPDRATYDITSDAHFTSIVKSLYNCGWIADYVDNEGYQVLRRI